MKENISKRTRKPIFFRMGGGWKSVSTDSIMYMEASADSLKTRSPAVVRIQGRGVAGTIAAKVRHLFGLCKDFYAKVGKRR